jgi:hypothetical protein
MNTFPWKSLPASLALLLAGYSLLGQGVPVPPNPPVRPPETPEQRAAREAAHQARLAANRVRFDPWLAFPMTLADGSPANRDSIDADTRARLLALADELRVKYGAMRAEMQRRGIPTRITFANGEVGEVRLEGNSISILANDDIEGADTISTDELWPAGSTGLALNGTNTVVGIWEVGGIPRTNHLELNGRVVDREGGNPATSHGTGVGSVIAAAGVASPVFGGITYTNGARGHVLCGDVVGAEHRVQHRRTGNRVSGRTADLESFLQHHLRLAARWSQLDLVWLHQHQSDRGLEVRGLHR